MRNQSLKFFLFFCFLFFMTTLLATGKIFAPDSRLTDSGYITAQAARLPN